MADVINTRAYLSTSGSSSKAGIQRSVVVSRHTPPQTDVRTLMSIGSRRSHDGDRHLSLFGVGRLLISVHSYVAFIGLVCIFVHIVANYFFGGWWQFFRVFRPAALMLTEVVKPKPLLIATAVGVVVISGIAATDFAKRDTLIVTNVEGEPKLDGILNEGLWNKARPVPIHSQQGENKAGAQSETIG